MAIAITGLGVVSPAGVGAEALFATLDGGLAPGGALARVGEFGAREQIAPASLRRLPRLSQMVIVAARQALAGAGGSWDETRVGVVLGTGLGTLQETIAFMRGYLEGGPEAASPLLFPSSVMNAAAGQLALECRLRGVNTTVNHRDVSPLGAIGMACHFLELGRADALLVGAVDELNAPAEHGYRTFGGVTPTQMRPYDRARDGLALGEGAGIVLLEREEDAVRRGARVRARIAAVAESSEARARVGWGGARSWPEASRAVRQAAAGHRIGWVAGGGNGTALDEHELDAVAEGLGMLPPVSSVLAHSGEHMSSAMVRVLAAIHALESQSLPGTPGLENPLPRFADSLVRVRRSAALDAVLVPSFAQGGANAALVLRRSCQLSAVDC